MNANTILVGLLAGALSLSLVPAGSAYVFGDPCDVALGELEEVLQKRAHAIQYQNPDEAHTYGPELSASLGNAEEECKQWRQEGFTAASATASSADMPCRDSRADFPTFVRMDIVVNRYHHTINDGGWATYDQKADREMLPGLLKYQKHYRIQGVEAGEEVWNNGVGVIYYRGVPLPASTSQVNGGCGSANTDVCWGEATAQYLGAFTVTVTSSFNNCP